MYAVSHSIAHRGPSASRARSRWQPYSAATSTPLQIRTPPPNYLNTPTVTPSPPSSCSNPPLTACAPERPRRFPVQSLSHGQTCQIREALKNRYVTRLIDQAVDSLCDIWHPEDIPAVFRTTSQTACATPVCEETLGSAPASTMDPSYASRMRNTQLPSPVSPSTQTSPLSPPASTSASAFPNDASQYEDARSSQHIPLKGFVHEVLRRSRTSTGVLQTALCYLEAIRAKVPEILRKEKSKARGTDQAPEEDAGSRIIIAEDSASHDAPGIAASSVCDTVRVDDENQMPLPITPSCAPVHPSTATTAKTPASVLPPLPPLPSPLLCPRRTFLACLVLATKFVQDRSYSNRAWAKLAGLPPREIGRCERALGDALEWRLWVGKTPSPVPVSTAGAGAGRQPVTRTKSESTLAFSPSASWKSPETSTISHPSVQGTKSGLRRNATMPIIESSTYSNEGIPPPVLFTSLRPVEEPESMIFSGEPGTMDPQCTPLVQAPLLRTFAPTIPSYSQPELSPPFSTPGLSYSPMSTASTSSSEDGDRTIQMLSMSDIPTPFVGHTTSAYQSKYDNGMVFGKSSEAVYLTEASTDSAPCISFPQAPMSSHIYVNPATYQCSSMLQGLPGGMLPQSWPIGFGPSP